MGTVIWIGIAAIIVIALVIAAIGKPGDGPGGTRKAATRGDRASVRRGSSRSYSGAGAYSGGHAASTWGGDSGSCGDASSGGGFSGGDCGGGGSF